MINWYVWNLTQDALDDYKITLDPTGQKNNSYHFEDVPLSEIDGSDAARNFMQIRLSPDNNQFAWDEELAASLARDLKLPICTWPKLLLWRFGGNAYIVSGNHRERELRKADPAAVVQAIVVVSDDHNLMKRLGRSENRKHGARTSKEENIFYAVDAVLKGHQTQQEAMREYDVIRSEFEPVYHKKFVIDKMAGKYTGKISDLLAHEDLLGPLYKMKGATEEDQLALLDGLLQAAKHCSELNRSYVQSAVDNVFSLTGRHQAQAISDFAQDLLKRVKSEKNGATSRPKTPATHGMRIWKTLKEVEKLINAKPRKSAGWKPGFQREAEEIVRGLNDYFNK